MCSRLSLKTNPVLQLATSSSEETARPPAMRVPEPAAGMEFVPRDSQGRFFLVLTTYARVYRDLKLGNGVLDSPWSERVETDSQAVPDQKRDAQDHLILA
jgi:hypothetical protein